MNDLEEEYKKNRGTPKPTEQSMSFYNNWQFAEKSSGTKKGTFYKSSFHSQTSTKHSLEHMERKSKVTYLLIQDSSVNDNKQYEDVKKFKEQAEKIYKEKIGQKMQPKAKENLVKEAVLNTKPNTSIEDIEKTFKNLNKRFTGHHIKAISIHRDEGVFIDTKYDLKDLEYSSSTLSWKHIKLNKDVTNEVIDYAPNRNIFYNQENRSWYFDKNFAGENKANVSNYQKKINYHAHVLYSNFNKDTGKTARMDRTDMRELQTIVADSLGMQRGVEFSKSKRMNHWQLKRAIDAKRELKLSTQGELAKQKDLQNEMRILREELKKQGTAKREDYAKLEQLNKVLKEQITNKELSLNDMKKIFDEKMKTIDYQNKLLDKQDERIKNQKSDIESLESKVHKRELYIDGSIPKKRVKIKDGLLSSKEVYIYDTEGVKTYVEKTKDTQKSLKSEVKNLKKENSILKDENLELDMFKVFVKKHFKSTDLDKVKEIIKIVMPKIDNSNKINAKINNIER